MPATVTLVVTRYRPDVEAAPTTQAYEVPFRKDWVVLDALNHVKDRLDGSLSFRWSCRMGVCGSCGMMVNGTPRLTCGAFLAEYLPGPIRVEPLQHFPIVRDLVVDISDFLEKLTHVRPWLIRRHEPSPPGEYLQTPEQLDVYKQYSMCINCLLCYAACPVYGIEPSFLGPAAITLSHRYNRDSRDHGSEQRMDILSRPEGVWECALVGECTRVCPKDVDPARAIQQAKLSASLHALRSLVVPRGGS